MNNDNGEKLTKNIPEVKIETTKESKKGSIFFTAISVGLICLLLGIIIGGLSQQILSQKFSNNTTIFPPSQNSISN